jgi:hypothetical protein
MWGVASSGDDVTARRRRRPCVEAMRFSVGLRTRDVDVARLFVRRATGIGSCNRVSGVALRSEWLLEQAISLLSKGESLSGWTSRMGGLDRVTDGSTSTRLSGTGYVPTCSSSCEMSTSSC